MGIGEAGTLKRFKALRLGRHTGISPNRARSISMAQRTASIAEFDHNGIAEARFALFRDVRVGSIKSPRSVRNRAGAGSSAAPALCYDLCPGLGGETGPTSPCRRPT